jgi:hypothetical protein
MVVSECRGRQRLVHARTAVWLIAELLGEVGIVEYTGDFDEASESLLSQFFWNLLGVNIPVSTPRP